MSGTINLGDNYSVEEDSNGDLVIKDSTGTSVLKHEVGADIISAVAPFDAIDADAGKLLSALDANSKDINNIAALEATNADTRNGYQNKTSSRSLNTTETNDTESDLDIQVTLQATADATPYNTKINIDGINLGGPRGVLDNSERVVIKDVVKAGASYEIREFGGSADLEVDTWFEQQ